VGAAPAKEATDLSRDVEAPRDGKPLRCCGWSCGTQPRYQRANEPQLLTFNHPFDRFPNELGACSGMNNPLLEAVHEKGRGPRSERPGSPGRFVVRRARGNQNDTHRDRIRCTNHRRYL